MTEPYLGEIRLVAFTFAPRGWALCDGRILNIAENVSLFELIGTTYGGDGQTTFALPDLRGRLPQHRVTFESVGKAGGSSSVVVQDGFSQNAPTAASVSVAESPGAGTDPVLNGTVPDNNMQPYLALNFVIALEGHHPNANNF